MWRYEEIWDGMQAIVADERLRLFDLDLPGRSGGNLRVFICGQQPGQSVTLDDCARVSRRLDVWLEGHLGLEANYTLEVSSPGINRRLRRREHFSEAVGERVKLVVKGGDTNDVVIGKLSAFESDMVQLEAETDNGVGERSSLAEQTRTIEFSKIAQATVEFVFGDV